MSNHLASVLRSTALTLLPLAGLLASIVHAENTFEASGVVQSIDAPLRMIVLDDEKFRVDESVFITDKNQRVPAMQRLRAKEVIIINGTISADGLKTIMAIEATGTDGSFPERMP